MSKTYALLLDSYRELNSKRLFWITMILSALVVAAMACVGVTHGVSFDPPGQSFGPRLGDLHLTFFGWTSPLPASPFEITDEKSLYKVLFSWLGVGFWLSFIGSILGLVSTAGMFPDFMASGSIDLYLSKPISRLRLFVTKYLGGLLFVTLQMGVFAAASFLLLGVRGHSWEPSLFISIPLVVLMFSYLFAFCVLMGVMTRSTIAALLLTVLFWFFLWGIQKAESIVTLMQAATDVEYARDDRQLERYKQQLPRMPEFPPSTAPSASPLTRVRHGRSVDFETEPQTRPEMQAKIDQLEERKKDRPQTLNTVALVIRCVQAPLPKTTATTDLLDRELIKRAKLPPSDSNTPDIASPDQANEEYRRRHEAVPASYIIGTSLGFELLILAIAAWRFCSRDY